MGWINLGNPAPKAEPVQYQPVAWPANEIKSFGEPNIDSNVLFTEVVVSRRTRRSFGKVTDDQLSQLLWLSVHCQEKGNTELGFPLERQPAPSGGAIHPIHTLISFNKDEPIWRYNQYDHVLSSVDITQEKVHSLWSTVSGVVNPEQGAILLFVAEPGKTFAKYDDGCSVVWRDAGVLQGHMSLVAEALSLNFCLLGITGEPWINQLDRQGRLFGVGMALLGARA